MTFSTAQNLLISAYVATSLSQFPHNSDGAIDIANALNKPSNPVISIWNPETKVSDIADAIIWDRYTPTDVPDTTVVYTNRILTIQTKQMNLQSMLQGRATLDLSKANIRAGLRDAVINLPAGTAGVNVHPGGASGITVMSACVRNANQIEAVLAGADVTVGGVTAKVPTYTGGISYFDVIVAMGW